MPFLRPGEHSRDAIQTYVTNALQFSWGAHDSSSLHWEDHPGYVQWAGWAEGVQIEVSSAQFLGRPFTPLEQELLTSLGFQAPNERIPNHWQRIESYDGLPYAAEALTAVLFEVLLEIPSFTFGTTLDPVAELVDYGAPTELIALIREVADEQPVMTHRSGGQGAFCIVKASENAPGAAYVDHRRMLIALSPGDATPLMAQAGLTAEQRNDTTWRVRVEPADLLRAGVRQLVFDALARALTRGRVRRDAAPHDAEPAASSPVVAPATSLQEIALIFARSLLGKAQLLPTLLPYQQSRLRESMSDDLKKYCDLAVPDFQLPMVSEAAWLKAQELNIDLCALRWHTQPRVDPGREIFHNEHVVPVNMLRDACLAAATEEDIAEVLTTRVRIAWILKTEDRVLNNNGHRVKRDDPDGAYAQAGIVLRVCHP